MCKRVYACVFVNALRWSVYAHRHAGRQAISCTHQFADTHACTRTKYILLYSKGKDRSNYRHTTKRRPKHRHSHSAKQTQTQAVSQWTPNFSNYLTQERWLTTDKQFNRYCMSISRRSDGWLRTNNVSEVLRKQSEQQVCRGTVTHQRSSVGSQVLYWFRRGQVSITRYRVLDLRQS